MELWKDIKDYEGLYQVSNFGNVKRIEGVVTRKDGRTRRVKETILKPTTNNKGYLCVQLCKNGKGKLCTIHRLVALSFIENHLNLPVVNHIDSNQLNNRLDNLEWTTAQGNTVHSIEQGRFVKLTGNTPYREDHPKLEEARKLIADGLSMREVSKQLHICRNVLAKHGIKSNHGSAK